MDHNIEAINHLQFNLQPITKQRTLILYVLLNLMVDGLQKFVKQLKLQTVLLYHANAILLINKAL